MTIEQLKRYVTYLIQTQTSFGVVLKTPLANFPSAFIVFEDWSLEIASVSDEGISTIVVAENIISPTSADEVGVLIAFKDIAQITVSHIVNDDYDSITDVLDSSFTPCEKGVKGSEEHSSKMLLSRPENRLLYEQQKNKQGGSPPDSAA